MLKANGGAVKLWKRRKEWHSPFPYGDVSVLPKFSSRVKQMKIPAFDSNNFQSKDLSRPTFMDENRHH